MAGNDEFLKKSYEAYQRDMKRKKIALVMVCCSMLLNGCLYDQKKGIDPAAPATTQQKAGVKDQAGTSRVGEQQLPAIREADLSDSGKAISATASIDGGTVLPSIEYIAGRISEYNRKVDRWRERDGQAAVLRVPANESEKMVNCFRELQKVLNGYNRLHEQLLQQASAASSAGGMRAREIFDLQQSDIAFVDGECGQMVAGGQGYGGLAMFKSSSSAGLSPAEAMIVQYAEKGQYEDLVQAWKQIPEADAARLQWKTKMLYGNALMALQQDTEAVKLYRQMVDQAAPAGGQAADLLNLRKMLADLYIASGDFRAAEAEYLQISKDYKEMAKVEEWAILQRSLLERSDQSGAELKDYSEMMKNYLGYNPAKDGYTVVWQADKFLQTYPYSPVASNVDLMRTSARERADKWSKNVLTEADVLADQKQYQEALGKLKTVPGSVVNPEIQQQLAKKTNDVALAEKLATETVKIQQTQDLERLWNEAVGLMDAAKYDKAIEAFTPLLSSAYADKAEKKIAEASLLAAEAERRDAAELFIRFTKASDAETKKKLLVESRHLLMNILFKYPGVEITEKVKGNIQRVEKEMNALDPNLLGDSKGTGQIPVNAAPGATIPPPVSRDQSGAVAAPGNTGTLMH